MNVKSKPDQKRLLEEIENDTSFYNKFTELGFKIEKENFIDFIKTLIPILYEEKDASMDDLKYMAKLLYCGNEEMIKSYFRLCESIRSDILVQWFNELIKISKKKRVPIDNVDVYYFPFNKIRAFNDYNYTNETMKEEVESFIFLKNEVEMVFFAGKENIFSNSSLFSMVSDMLKEGKTKPEIANALREKGLSLSIIGALLYEGGLNKEEHFATQKQCSDFYQKKAQALLKGDSEEKA